MSHHSITTCSRFSQLLVPQSSVFATQPITREPVSKMKCLIFSAVSIRTTSCNPSRQPCSSSRNLQLKFGSKNCIFLKTLLPKTICSNLCFKPTTRRSKTGSRGWKLHRLRRMLFGTIYLDSKTKCNNTKNGNLHIQQKETINLQALTYRIL